MVPMPCHTVPVRNVAVQVRRPATPLRPVASLLRGVATQLSRLATPLSAIATQVRRIAPPLSRLAVELRRLAIQPIPLKNDHFQPFSRFWQGVPAKRTARLRRPNADNLNKQRER